MSVARKGRRSKSSILSVSVFFCVEARLEDSESFVRSNDQQRKKKAAC